MTHLIPTSALRAAVLLVAVGPRPFCRPPIPPGPAAARLAELPARVDVRDVPTGATDVWVRAGYAVDQPGLEGAAWVTAHAVAPDGVAVDVDAEWVRFHIPCSDVPCVSAAVRTIVSSPDGDAVHDAVQRARQRIVDLDPGAAVEAVAELWLYEGHPYGHLPMGRFGALSVIDGAVAQTLHRRHYVRATTHVTVDTPELAAALVPVLEPLPTTMQPDLPLQQPIQVTTPRAMVLHTATDPGTAVAVMALPADTPDGDLPTRAEMLSHRRIGAPPEHDRMQTHLAVVAQGKSDVFAAEALLRAIAELRCHPVFADAAAAPTLVFGTTDPQALQQLLTEEMPPTNVDCISEDTSAAPALTPSDMHTVRLEGMFQ